MYVCQIEKTFILSKLFEKHNFNLDAADYLIKDSQYAPSVHCSYYGCFQLMKHKLKVIKNCSYEEIESNMSGSSSHTYLINELKYYLNPRNNSKIKEPKHAANFKDSIKDLKDFRQKSDYENVEISPEDAEKSLRIAKEICNILKKL